MFVRNYDSFLLNVMTTLYKEEIMYMDKENLKQEILDILEKHNYISGLSECPMTTLKFLLKIDDVSIGDEVTIIGKDGDAEITVFDLAKKLNGPYVYVLSNIGKRVLRIYKK